MIRKPAVAGVFYPAKPDELRTLVDSFLGRAARRERAFGIMVPHAGFIYSGRIAGVTFSAVDLPDRFIILCPNHTGFGAKASIMSKGEWETPLGRVPIDEPLASAIREGADVLEEDPGAHAREHSLEVQLPFLQRLKKEPRFVPISLGTRRPDELRTIGHAIARAVSACGDRVMLVASSDMTHRESRESAARQDRLALEKVEALDAAGLLEVVEKHEISMCGAGPTACALYAAKELGARRGEVVKYGTSGDTTGDFEDVVGYAGAMFL